MKVLIVDDEPGAARRLADGVAAEGFAECFAAENAEEAVGILNREGALDLLVTEVFLEGIDGFTLHETIRPWLPDLRVIFLSKHPLLDSDDRVGGWPVLAKPVEAGALADFVRDFCAPHEAPVPPADPVPGGMLGNYRIDEILGADPDGNYYRAVQLSIDREVELHALDSARAVDPAVVERFLADARTKANVHHSVLLSVFEAGQQDGIYFYTSEVRAGSSLADLAAQGASLDPRVVLQLLHSVAEVMVHLSHEKIAHEPIRPEHVIVDHRQRARLANTAVSEPSGVTAVQEMQALAAMLAPLLRPSEQSPPVQQLLFEMSSESVILRSWNALLYEVKRCATGASAQHTPRLDATNRAAIEAVGAARKRQRKTRTALILAAVLIPLAGAGIWAWMMFKPQSEPMLAEGNSALEKMVRIPAGGFLFRGENVVLPDFWIDVHEVTIGQYADFLAWAEAHPGEAAALAPPGMPAGHTYVPKGWADEETSAGTRLGYHSIAQAEGTYEDGRIGLGTPVFGVDWFDACAYAAWKGRRLPSEQEWEKAALGLEGKKFPWGDEWIPGRANLAANDASRKWSGVDDFADDRSPFGLVGGAGNVSEWTRTVDTPAPGVLKPVIRGGNWSDATVDLHLRRNDLEAAQSAATVGFRTASDKPPSP